MSSSIIPELPLQQPMSTKRKRGDGQEDAIPKKKTKTKASSTGRNKASNMLEEVYNDSIRNIEKDLKSLDKKAKNQKWPDVNDVFLAITNDDYAGAASEHLPAVEKLEGMDDGLTFVFNLLMAIADTSHTDLNKTAKMSGWGDSEGSYAELDQALLDIIEKREKPAIRLDNLPEVPRRWTREYTSVGEFTIGRPDQQQWGGISDQKMEWEEKRRVARRSRRESTEDWASVALAELKEDRDCLDEYGVEGYFPNSIAALEGLLADTTAANDDTSTGNESDW